MTRTLQKGRAAARSAFTLIELIVVIVIIGILAAVAAVSYNSFIGNAENVQLDSSAASIVKMVQAQSAFDQMAPSLQADTVVNGGKGYGTDLLAVDAWPFYSDMPLADVTGVSIDTATGVLTIEHADRECTATFGESAGASPTTELVCADK